MTSTSIIRVFIAICLLPASFALAAGATGKSSLGKHKPTQLPGAKPASNSALQVKLRAAPPKAGLAKNAANGKKNAKKADPISASGQWLHEVGGWTRTIRAVDPATGTTLGRSFSLAVDGQYVALPWTFIAEVWLGRGSAKFIVEDLRPENTQEAHLVDLDMGANLALLKADQPLIPSMARGRIRLDNPPAGEALVVLTSRDWIRPGARFISAKIEGNYTRYQIAVGGNEYSSARYLFDRLGRLTAITPSQDVGADPWSIAGKSVFEILRRRDGPQPASVNNDELRFRQITGWQDKWTSSFIAANGGVSLQGLDCRSYLTSVENQGLAEKIRNVRAMSCDHDFSLPVGGGYTAGLEVWSGEVNLRAGAAAPGTEIEKAFTGDAFAGLAKNAGLVNLMTVPECNENEVANRYGQDVRVRFCTSALKIGNGLGDSVVSVTTNDGGSKANFVVARLKGFNQANSKRILQALIDNVRSIK